MHLNRDLAAVSYQSWVKALRGDIWYQWNHLSHKSSIPKSPYSCAQIDCYHSYQSSRCKVVCSITMRGSMSWDVIGRCFPSTAKASVLRMSALHWVIIQPISSSDLSICCEVTRLILFCFVHVVLSIYNVADA